MSKPVTVRLEPDGGRIQALGTDQAAGVWAENLTMTSDKRGPLSAAFDLRRDPAAIWPDLAAFTPVEIEVASSLVWSGRLKETPGRDTEHALSVQCEGLQVTPDDDMYERLYVHNKLGDWKDMRSSPTAVLGQGAGQLPAACQVSTEGNAVALSFPREVSYAANTQCGVFLDLGPDARARRISIDIDVLRPHGEFFLLVRSAATVAAAQYAPTLITASANGTFSGTVPASDRFLVIFVEPNAAVSYVDQDTMFRVKGVRVYGQTAYESAHQSALKASAVVVDALTFAPLLSTDRSQITATSFNIPSLAPGEPRTPREIIDTVNAYHDWTFKLDNQNRPVFRAKSSTPRVKIGQWSAAEVEDASANSSEDIYSDVIVQAQTPAGEPIRVRRTNTAVRARIGATRTKTLQVASPLPSDGVAAAQIGDVWLTGHTSTPFKGTVKLTGPDAVRDFTAGTPVAPELLLLMTDELLHLDDRVDPDTGALGRNGRITQVTYVPARDEATVALDNTRGNVDALLSRLAVTTGS